MAAMTRLFRMSRHLGRQNHHHSCNSSFSTTSNFHSSSYSSKYKCSFSKGDFGAESTFLVSHVYGGTGDRNLKIKKLTEAGGEVKASSGYAETAKTEEGLDLDLLLSNVRKERPWKLYIQRFIEKGIMDCRFFTLFGVVGSLLGSFLCYIEGCFLILGSYVQYFHALSRGSDLGNLVHLLIEAIDMYLVATAMLVFGVGLHILFVGSYDLDNNSKQSNSLIKTLPSHVGMNSIMQAKTKIGHAIVMILQVGVLEKFKSVPLVSGLDLACFAGAVFLSAICIFLLSKLSITATNTPDT